MKTLFLSELSSVVASLSPLSSESDTIFLLVPTIGIFFFPEDFRTLGAMCWNILIVILLIRPLGDIFTDFKIFEGFFHFEKNSVFSVITWNFAFYWIFFGSNIPLLVDFSTHWYGNVKDYFSGEWLDFLSAFFSLLLQIFFQCDYYEVGGNDCIHSCIFSSLRRPYTSPLWQRNVKADTTIWKYCSPSLRHFSSESYGYCQHEKSPSLFENHHEWSSQHWEVFSLPRKLFVLHPESRKTYSEMCFSFCGGDIRNGRTISRIH